MFSMLSLGSDPALMDSMYELRHRVFRGRLGWAVESRNGRERDSFDLPSTRYLVHVEGHRVTGCARVMPTTGPNMLRDVFPVLMAGKSVPCSPAIWEISRFAVDTSSRTNGFLGSLTSGMLIGLLQFALAHRLRGYVAVTDTRMERIIHRSGWEVHRLGPVQQIGVTKAIAIYVDTNEEILEKVRTKTGAYIRLFSFENV